MSANHDSEKLYRKFIAGQSVALFKGTYLLGSVFFLLLNVKLKLPFREITTYLNEKAGFRLIHVDFAFD